MKTISELFFSSYYFANNHGSHPFSVRSSHWNTPIPLNLNIPVIRLKRYHVKLCHHSSEGEKQHRGTQIIAQTTTRSFPKAHKIFFDTLMPILTSFEPSLRNEAPRIGKERFVIVGEICAG
jgi:hypothetical protein